MQARRIARELTLLSLSQLSPKPERLATQSLHDLVLAAVRTLTTEAKDSLETAAEELKRGHDRLLDSEIRAADCRSAHAMLSEAIELAQAAINRLGEAIELPEFVQLTNQIEVRDYAVQLLSATTENRVSVDQALTNAMVDWQLSRLPRVDRDILRIAVTEILFLGIPERVAFNEAVELAKRYSDDQGRRFINGVLRRVSNQLKAGDRSPQTTP